MARYEKGSESQASIMQAAKQLFYQNGYQATTVRDIAKVSGLNFGLLRYYFGAKADIGLLAYQDFRSSLYNWIRLQIMKSEQQFFFGEAAELKFCAKSPEFARFLTEIGAEQTVREYLEREALAAVRQNSSTDEEEDRIVYHGAAVAALKTAAVGLLRSGNYADENTVIQSYLNAVFGCCEVAGREGLTQEILLFCQRYTFNIVSGFIPVIVRG